MAIVIHVLFNVVKSLSMSKSAGKVGVSLASILIINVEHHVKAIIISLAYEDLSIKTHF